jgi:hypothetical protein
MIEAGRVLAELIFHLKGKGRIKVSQLYLAGIILLTRTVKSYPYSAVRWMPKELLSFLFLIKHMPGKKLYRLVSSISNRINSIFTYSRLFIITTLFMLILS